MRRQSFIFVLRFICQWGSVANIWNNYFHNERERKNENPCGNLHFTVFCVYSLQETGFRDPRLIEAVYHSCLRNVLPELLQDVDLLTGIIYGTCMMALRSIFFLQFGNSWTACFCNNGESERGGPAAWPVSSLIQIPFIFISGDVCRLLFVLQKAVTSQWMQNGSEAICTTSAVLRRVRQSLFRHAAACVEAQCGHLVDPWSTLFVRRPPLVHCASEALS